MQSVVYLLSLLQVLHVIQNLQMLMNELKICLLCVHEVIVYRLMNLYFRLDSTGLEFKKSAKIGGSTVRVLTLKRWQTINFLTESQKVDILVYEVDKEME